MKKSAMTPDFYKGKRVLVTGHTGFKGSWLVEILLSMGADVTGISLPANTTPNLFSVLNLNERVKNYFFDIRDHGALLSRCQDIKPEIVFHLAAQAIVRDSYNDPLYTYSTNIIGTANILEVSRSVESIKSVVIITTDKVYDNKEWVYPYRENDALGGHDPYSASKAAADIVTSSFIKSFFNPKDFGIKHNTLIAIARAGNVIGGGDWAPHRLVPDIMRSFFEDNKDVVIRSPDSVRPWEHVLEPLSGYLLLGEKLYEGDIAVSTAWNFGPDNSGFINVKNVVEDMIKDMSIGSLRVEPDSSKHEARLLKLDINKARDLLDWLPVLTYEKSINLTTSWYKSYYDGKVDMIEFTRNQIKDFFNIKL